MTEARCNYGTLLKLAPVTLQGQHVHKVDVQDKSKEEQRVVLEYLKKLNCNALDLLRISSDSNDIHILKEILQISGPSLKQLDINIKGDPRYIRLLAVILKHCHSHQLMHLKYRHYNEIRPLNLRLDGRLLPRRPLQNIISLNIGCAMEMNYFQRLLELLPRLKSIYINKDLMTDTSHNDNDNDNYNNNNNNNSNSNINSGSQLIHLLCNRSSLLPVCQNVDICGGNDKYNDNDKIIDGSNRIASNFSRQFIMSVTNNGTDGYRIQSTGKEDVRRSKLRCLIIQNIQGGINQEIISSVFEKHHLTLEAICVTHCPLATLLFPPSKFTNLCDIQINDTNIILSTNQTTAQNLFTMLQSSPCLRNVYLQCQMPFRQVISGLQQRQQLQTLCLSDSTGMGALILNPPVTGWPQLRCLSLHGVVDLQASSELLNLKNAILNTPCLEMIDLDPALVTREDILPTIGNLDNLHYLRIRRNKAMPVIIHRTSTVSAESIVAMLHGNCSRSLRRLCLLDIMTVTDGVLDAIVGNFANSNLEYLQIGYSRSPFILRRNRRRMRLQGGGERGGGEGENTTERITANGIQRFGNGFMGTMQQLKYLGLSEIWNSSRFASTEEMKQIEEACRELREMLTSERITVCLENNRDMFITAFGQTPMDPFSSFFNQI
ncbi:hypothetical protein INT45_001374 [Circinella minor]|uniref:Uncharacterized protein n=1 Tax=Circinella minor TaxID=1195481 RepID=A0A8H7RUA6_9FUNG|nr:hypothetical protein INT45_001374 [Circinella minor]